MSFRNYLVTKGGQLVRQFIRSPNYVPGVSGWTINKDGSVEFSNGIFRGTIINSAGLFQYGGPPAGGNLVETEGISAAGTDPHGNMYLPGATTYNDLTGYAVQSYQGAVNFYVGSLAIGWTLVGSILGQPSVAADHAISISNTNAVVFSTSHAWIFPSGDVTGGTDLANINAALSHGYSVHLIPGLYHVNAPISFPSYGILRGMGRTALGKQNMTVIQATAAMPAVIASANYLSNTVGGNTGGFIADLQVDANSLASNNIVLMTFDAVIRNCSMENPLFNCILFTALTRNGTAGLTGDTPNNRIESCIMHNYGQYAVQTNDGANTVFTDGFLTDCIIATGAGGGSGARAVSLDHSAGWLISGNHFYGLAGHGIMAGVPFNTRITGNYFEAWGQSATASTYYAIDCVTAPANGGHGLIIEGNNFYGSAAPGNPASNIVGIGLLTPTGATNYFLVTDNEVFFGPAAGFASAVGIKWSNGGATSVTNGVSTGNQVHGTWTTPVQQNPAGGTITLTAGV